MKRLFLCVISFSLFSCSFFKKKQNIDDSVLARYEQDFLYRSDVNGLLPPNHTLEDSVSIVSNYVSNWVLDKMLMKKAEENLSSGHKSELENLIEKYRKDLYTKYYVESLVQEKLDTVVLESEIDSFYSNNKGLFKSGETLVKLRYIQVSEVGLKKSKFIEKFKRFNSKDREELASAPTDFYYCYLNDSTWVRLSDVLEKLPFLQGKVREDFYQHKDSTGLYSLVRIKSVLGKDKDAPIEYIQPTIKQIILNRRKADYIKNLEKDLIESAIKRKQFEIYDN